VHILSAPDPNSSDRDRAYEAGRACHRGVELAPDVFDRAWARLAAARHARGEAQGKSDANPVSAGDLYLAVACDAGATGAWETLSREYLPRLRGLLRKHGATIGEAEDLLADLPGLLCEPPPTAVARTRIGTYDGSGLLVSWLSIYVLRAVNARRRQRSAGPGLPADPESERATLRDEARQHVLGAEALGRFEATIAGSWATLTTRESLAILLKHRDWLSGRAIARILGVGEPRVSRILAAGLEKIRAAVSRGQLGTPPGSRTPDRAVWMELTHALERHLARVAASSHDQGDEPRA
jgi:DNA-directed RNA polymerase specialized sigma24 family protein